MQKAVHRTRSCALLDILKVLYSDSHICLDFSKYFKYSVQILAAVTGRYLCAYTSLALRNDRITEANNINAFFKTSCCKLLCNLGIKQQATEALAELGIDICVLGSGGGRRIPDDMDFDEGMKQLYEALQVIGDCGAKYGVTIVLEPLNRMEANTITTLAEGAQIVRKKNDEASSEQELAL